jgi:NadR type nicotinamide-nucleotide adenylyltransferase
MNTRKANHVSRISIIGPECTGKSELASFLASYYNTVWVPEFARIYLNKLKRPYEQADLTRIARWQLLTEDELALTANKILICDTDLYVIKVWSEYKYKSCDSFILEQIKKRTYALHILTYIDIPWEEDPQREHPNQREELFNIYKEELLKANVPFVEIRGDRALRRSTAINAIDQLLRS